MRLIDADALVDGYKHMGYDPTEFEEESYQEGWCKGFNAAVEHCISHVVHAPTVEPQRMKGKWDARGWNNAYWKCSNCDELTVFPFNFCPFCGSDMRGEEDESRSYNR